MARALSLFAVLALITLFALLNWTAFTTPTLLSFGVTTAQAPLGLIMLGLSIFLALLFVTWAISSQASMLFETRRHTKELHAQRELADKAEASRFVELRSFLTDELARLRDEQRLALEQNTNTLAAHIGELEDRLERGDLAPRDLALHRDGSGLPPLRR